MSQLRDVALGAAILVNSYAPVSGQMRYRVDFEYRGFSRNTTLASGVALFGRMSTLGGLVDCAGNECFEAAAAAGSMLLLGATLLAAVLVARVLAIAAMDR